MNNERIKELEQFVEEFNKKLEEAQRNYEKKLDIERRTKSVEKNEKREIKKHFTQNIFKEQQPWKPNNYKCREFETFKKLEHKSLSDWEQLRINLLKRSYIKQEELPQKRDFQYTKSHGNEFGEEKNLNSLSEVGRSIITKFVNDNEQVINKLKEKEEEIYKYKHSKPQPEYNPWKYTNHSLKEFSTIPADKIHAFKNYPKPKFLIQEPFRRPKIFSDYFEKEIKNL